MAFAFGVAASVVIILLGFVLFRRQGGSVYVGHHSADGSPPLVGELGLLLSFAACGGLGLMTLIRRRTLRDQRRTLSGLTGNAAAVDVQLSKSSSPSDVTINLPR
jgi:hypothetical protein